MAMKCHEVLSTQICYICEAQSPGILKNITFVWFHANNFAQFRAESLTMVEFNWLVSSSDLHEHSTVSFS